jgi:hypothetical protein
MEEEEYENLHQAVPIGSAMWRATDVHQRAGGSA